MSIFVRPPRRRAAARTSGGSATGQALVEFALVLPIFLTIVLGIIEFAFVFNAVLSINFVSRNATLVAAEAGNAAGADCVILENIELELSSPTDARKIQSVEIFWSDSNGVVQQSGAALTRYARTGSTTCTYGDGSTVTVPYTSTANGYPEGSRCTYLNGCGSPHTGLDHVGVRIVYTHSWVTPLHGFVGGGGAGLSFDRTNVMRMEPVL